MGSALNDLSREVGGALGTAVIGSVVTAVYRSSLQIPGAPAQLVARARASFAIAIHAGGTTGAHARDAFVEGIHTGLLYAAGAAIVAAVSVAVLLRSDAKVPLAADEHEHQQITSQIFLCLAEGSHGQHRSRRKLTGQPLRCTSR